MTDGPALAIESGRGAGAQRAIAALRLILDGPAPGPWNMAVDEALLLAARRGEATLRLYSWSPGCLSFGRHQAAAGLYDRRLAARMGIDTVRRPSGGRAVYHEREITYSVAAPALAWGGLRESWRRVNRALARGLRELGVPAEVAGPRAAGSAAGPGAFACFRRPAPGEVTAGGRKLVGSAQWREAGAALQHGSILLRDDQWMAERLRCGAEVARRPPPAGGGGIAGLLGREPPWDEACAALARGFAAELGVVVEPGALAGEEAGRACRLEARYRSEAWTWRR